MAPMSDTPPVRSFPPVIADDARVLVLGSMPGHASLTAHRYYAHPRNLFWPIMGALFEAGPALDYDTRLLRLQAAGIALWDVAGECVRPGSLDARIRADTVVPNDIPGLLDAHPGIRRICFNGATAEALFRRHVLPAIPTPPEHVRLPSTSPAHAAMSFDAKLEAWRAGMRLAP